MKSQALLFPVLILIAPALAAAQDASAERTVDSERRGIHSRGADDAYRHGRVRHVEGSVTLHRADEASPEQAVPNLPFLPGDRLSTGRNGRAEVQLVDGTVFRLDRHSRLEYAAYDDRRGTERIVLALSSGDMIIRQGDGRDRTEISVEAPGGLAVDLLESGVYRIGIEGGETSVAVYEGEASVEGDRRVRVRQGEQVWARGSDIDGRPEDVDRPESDDFARWDEERQSSYAWARERSPYLPDDVAAYGPELEEYGTWYYEVEAGHVWRPYVSASWRPYSDGHWVWTAYGWTWVPSEPWGWAVSHYGRWGWSARLGWYWVPSGGWGPAWVSWAVNDDYVGWCPLGYRDRPVVIHERGHDRGARRDSFSSGSWTLARRGDIGARDLARRRVDASGVAHGLRPLENARARLTRELGVTERPLSVPRAVRTRPSPGDTVPELRTDPATTIPFPTARRRYESERDRDRIEEQRRSQPRESTRGERIEETPGQATSSPAQQGRSRGAREEASREESSRARSQDRDKDRDRHLLGPLFRPFSRGRSQNDGSGSSEPDRGTTVEKKRDTPRDSGDTSRDSGRANRTRPRSGPSTTSDEGFTREERKTRPSDSGSHREASPRIERREPTPPPPPPSNQSSGHAMRRDRNRDQ